MADGWGPADAEAHVFVEDLEHLALDDEDAHHLARVLRLRDGARVSASDGADRWLSCRLSFQGRQARLEPDGSIQVEPVVSPAVAVGVPLLKGDRPAWVVQKLTELGVDQVVLVEAARGVVRWRDVHNPAELLARLEKVARQAAMQSRRCRIPAILPPKTLLELAGEGRVTLAQRGGDRPREIPALLAVGPEGGWDPVELGLGLPTVGLGATVLRAETAAIAAGVILCALRSGVVL